MPLHWEEVKIGLTIQTYNIFNAVDRLKEQGNIFTGVLGKGIDLEKALKISRQILAEELKYFNYGFNS